MSRLVLTRHGQSQWNLEGRFTGWVDVDLTAQGENQARKGGQLLKAAGFAPKMAFTSVLKRAIRTLNLGLEELDRLWIPVEKTWRLNERHYGALTGMNKAETVEKHGKEQVMIWRRSYDITPPAASRDHPFSVHGDPRYADLSDDQIPDTESLATTLVRVKPVLTGPMAEALKDGDVLVSAHGNSLRAVMKLLFDIPKDEILKLEIPTGNPLMIELDGMTPTSVRYLDEDRAEPLPAV